MTYTEQGTASPERPARRRAYGSGSVYLRGSTWWVKYYVDGKPVFESTKCPKEKERDAWKFLRTRTEAVAAGRHIGPQAQRLTLAQLRDVLEGDYRAQGRRSWGRAASAFDKIAAHFGATSRALRVTAGALARYLSDRLDAGAARATVQKELAALKRAFNLAVEQGMLPARPHFPKLGKIRNAKQTWVNDSAWALIRPELPDYWQDLGDMAMGMPWRPRAEIRTLTWAQVDWERKRITLDPGTTKNGDGRVFPFTKAPDVEAALTRRLAYTQDVEARTGRAVPFVFHVEGVALRTDSDGRYYKPWRAACKRAGFPELSPHDFRRTAVRAYDRSGVSRAVIMRLAGMRTPEIFDRYNIVDEEADLNDGVARARHPVDAEA